MPQISVIVPVYKVESYICRCIDSLLAQTFTDFKLITVDDGSPDNCGSICDEYAMMDNCISIIHRKNAGVSGARNAGLQMITGHYVSFVDSDDYCKPDFLEHLFDAAQKSDIDLVQSGYVSIDDVGNIIGDKKRRIGFWTIETDESRIQFLTSNVLTYDIGWENWTALFKRQIIEKHRILYCEKCDNFAEDLCFMLEYILHCNRIASIDEHDYCYVHHEGSMMDTSKSTVKLNAMNEVTIQFGERFFKTVHGIRNRRKYAILYYYILRNQYCKIDLYAGKGINAISEIHKINHLFWHDKWMRRMTYQKRELSNVMGDKQAYLAILNARFCYHRNWYLHLIENKIVWRFFIR